MYIYYAYILIYFIGGLFSSTAGPLLPTNIAFKPFNKMWKSPLQRSRILGRMSDTDHSDGSQNLSNNDLTTNSSYNNMESTTVHPNINIRKRSPSLLKMGSWKIDRFRRHRTSLPNDSHQPNDFEITNSNPPLSIGVNPNLQDHGTQNMFPNINGFFF